MTPAASPPTPPPAPPPAAPPDPVFLATAVEIVLRAGAIQEEGRASGFQRPREHSGFRDGPARQPS